MKEVFADSSYWIAIINPKDQWHNTARNVRNNIRDSRIVTTDEVLVEVLTALGKSEVLRRQSAKMAKAILDNDGLEVIPQSRSSFLRGIELYEKRPDKEYSLVDCISMNVMHNKDMNEALTSDHHFEQEGFSILMTRQI